jgi:hypothetical protein
MKTTFCFPLSSFLLFFAYDPVQYEKYGTVQNGNFSIAYWHLEYKSEVPSSLKE